MFNTIVGYRFLGNECNLEKSLKELIDLDPTNVDNIQQAAAIAVGLEEYELAENYLRPIIGQDNDNNELSLMLSDTLILQGKHAEAIPILTSIIESYKATNEAKINAYSNLLKTLYDLGEYDKIADLISSLESDENTAALALLYKSRVASSKEDLNLALECLSEASSRLLETSSKSIIYGIANDAFNLENYWLAAEVFEKIIDLNADSQELRRYLQCLFETKRYNTLVSRVHSLKKKGFDSKYIAQFEWAGYLELQDLTNARRSLAEFIKNNPEDENAKLNLALIDFRTNASSKLATYLKSDIDISKLDLDSLIQLSQLYRSRKMIDKMLHTAYYFRRENPDNPKAHSSYIDMILGLGNLGKTLLDANVVGPNTVLIYEGGYFLIESEYSPSINNRELSFDDAQKRGFIGKKKGDEIILSTNRLTGDRSTQILEIQTKYVHALQDSMRNYEQRFVEQTDLIGLTLGEGDFAPLLQQIDETHENATSAEDLYSQGKLSIDLFAKSIGKNLIEVIYALRESPKIGVRASGGNVELENTIAEALDASEPEFVLDITALITLYELGFDNNGLAEKNLFTSHSTLELAIQEATRAEGESYQKGMTIFKQGNQYIRKEFTAKERKEKVSKLKDFVRWIQKNIPIKPFNEEIILGLSDNIKFSEIADLLAESQTDVMRLATLPNTFFYTDDAVLSLLAKEVLGVDSVWTQSYLAYLTRNGRMDPLDYGDSIIALAESNYHHLGVNPVILLQSLLRGEEAFNSLLRALSRKDVELKSMVRVIVDFLWLAKERGFSNYVLEKMSTIFEHLIIDHPKNEVLKELKDKIGTTLQSDSSYSGLILKQLEDWIEKNK